MIKNNPPVFIVKLHDAYLLYLSILLMVVLLMPNTVKANFGESCAILPISTADNYLMSNTAYGHIIGNIDMTTYIKGACDKKGTDFKFCLKLPDGAGLPCVPI